MVYKFFDKKSAVSGVYIPLEPNVELAIQLHKPIILKKEQFIQDLMTILGELI